MHRLIPFMIALPLAASGPNQFAANTYNQLARTKGNLVFSPVSISTVLAMALEGARGKTAEEMRTVLNSPPGPALLDKLKGDDLLLAQALWMDRGFPLLPDFVEALRAQYHAPPTPAEFSTNPEAARAAINRWTSEQTKDKIRELFAPGSLDRSTRLVLSSAIYFNGKWRSKFDPKETRNAPFHSQGGAEVETPFLNQTARFPYAETASAQVLEMPYGNGALAFDVILPKAGAAMPGMDADSLSAWLGHLQTKQVQVALPKFRAESSFGLRETLSAMGMPSAFTGAADFSGMDGKHDLAISQVVHKAYIDVSEEGTEAAAATGGVVSLTAFAPPAVFRADHPFLFLIRDTASGAILFAGRYETAKR
jgi:serpin B